MQRPSKCRTVLPTVQTTMGKSSLLSKCIVKSAVPGGVLSGSGLSLVRSNAAMGVVGFMRCSQREFVTPLLSGPPARKPEIEPGHSLQQAVYTPGPATVQRGAGWARGWLRSTTCQRPPLPWISSRPSPHSAMSFSTTSDRRVTIFGPRIWKSRRPLTVLVSFRVQSRVTGVVLPPERQKRGWLELVELMPVGSGDCSAFCFGAVLTMVLGGTQVLGCLNR